MLDRALVAALIVLLASSIPLARYRRLAALPSAIACALLAASIVVRWFASGHPPVFGTYEMDIAETLLLLVLGLVLRREAGERHLVATALVGALTLAHTFVLRTEATPLTISEQSLWIDLHAVLAWIAWAFYFHALLLAFREAGLQARAVWLLGRGFVAQTASGFAGAYYGTLLFATPWSWDPVQTLGILSWVLAGVALHFRLFFGVTPAWQRYFLALAVACYVAASKLIMFLPQGQSFHVFELGVLASGPK